LGGIWELWAITPNIGTLGRGINPISFRQAMRGLCKRGRNRKKPGTWYDLPSWSAPSRPLFDSPPPGVPSPDIEQCMPDSSGDHNDLCDFWENWEFEAGIRRQLLSQRPIPWKRICDSLVRTNKTLANAPDHRLRRIARLSRLPLDSDLTIPGKYIYVICGRAPPYVGLTGCRLYAQKKSNKNKKATKNKNKNKNKGKKYTKKYTTRYNNVSDEDALPHVDADVSNTSTETPSGPIIFEDDSGRAPFLRLGEHFRKGKTLKNIFRGRKKRAASMKLGFGRTPGLPRILARDGAESVTMVLVELVEQRQGGARERAWEKALAPTLNKVTPFGGIDVIRWETVLNEKVEPDSCLSIASTANDIMSSPNYPISLNSLLHFLSSALGRVRSQLFEKLFRFCKDRVKREWGLVLPRRFTTKVPSYDKSLISDLKQ
jgi:hypothetical protein